MEQLFLYILFIALAVIQFSSAYYAKKKSNPKIRWIVFGASMILFYTPIIYMFLYGYFNKIETFGFRELGLLILAVFGLVIPIAQVVFSLYYYIKED